MTFEHFVDVFGWAFLPFIAFHMVSMFSSLRWRHPQFSELFDAIYTPWLVVFQFLCAVQAFIDHDYGFAVFMSVCCAVIAYWWWNNENNRRRRKKLLDRVAGRIVDMGGKLKIVRSLGGANSFSRKFFPSTDQYENC